jgi:hypothetical protein
VTLWRSRLSALGLAGFGGLCLFAFFDMSSQYDRFKLPQYGVDAIDIRELGFYLWYTFWGTAAVLALTFALVRADLARYLVRGVERVLSRPGRLAAIAALCVLGCAFAVRHFVLLHQPVTDDESTYVFEAQTLLHGRVVNPLPEHQELFTNAFIILDQHGWYGKYPIGHPLVLAIGEALKARSLVIPVVGALSLWLAFLIGNQLFDRKRAALAVALLALSPQFVLTHATLLSQPSSALFMLLGMWALLHAPSDGRLRWPALAGAAFGFLLLVRPMPGVLIVLAAGVHELLQGWRSEQPPTLRSRAQRLLMMAPGLALGVAVFAWVNHLQAGHATTTGYETVHHGYGFLANPAGEIPSSFAAALARQNFWVLGWTASLVFVPFARPRRGALLFWGMIAADYAYRILVPKVMVSTTGPIYVFECVPLLVLAIADGATRIEPLLARLSSRPPRAWLAAFGVCATLVGLLLFVPIELRSAHRSSELRARVYRLLAKQHVKRALVFLYMLVDSNRGETWAYYPPNPSPSLDDDVLFLHSPRPEEGATAALDLWRTRFHDRRVFAYVDSGEHPFFHEVHLDQLPAPPIPPPPPHKRKHKHNSD